MDDPTKRRMIAHLEHEVAQFLGALAEFTALDEPGVLDLDRADPVRIRRTAFFEIVLLHARLLDDFLGMEPKCADDFWAGHFIDDWEVTSPIDGLPAPLPGGLSVRKCINKQLAHLTTARLSQQDFPIRDMADAIIAGLRDFVARAVPLGDRDLWQLNEWLYATWSTRRPPIRSGS
jgi:hypothetical protein